MNPDDFPPGTGFTRMPRSSVEQAVEAFKRSIAHIGRRLPPDEDWHPTLLLASRADVLVVVDLTELFRDFLGEVGKNLAADAMPLLVERADAYLAGFVSTAWMVEKPKEAIAVDAAGFTTTEGPMPSEHPDRVEIVGLFVASADEEQYHHAEIVRRAGRPPALRPWRFAPASIGGRFGNALRVAFGREPFIPPEEGAA